MSQTVVREFFTKASTDGPLLTRLKAAGDLEGLVEIAKAEGFHFSVADLNAVNPPVRKERLAESKLSPPIETRGCSQSSCDYTSYVKKCSTDAEVET